MTKYGEVRVADLVERKDDLIIEPPLAYFVDTDSTYQVGDVTVTEVIGLKTVAVQNGHVCLDNTTTTPLGIGGVFEGQYQDTLNYNTITVGIVADQDSATDGLVIQWSADGIAVTQTDEFSILANRGKVFTFSPANRYVSVKYTNGAVAQASLNIQTIFKKGGFKASSHRIKDSIVADDDASLVKAVVTGIDENGVFQNARISSGGYLITDDFFLEIAKGNIPGHSIYRKFGRISSIQASTPADCWEYGITSGAEEYTFSTTAAIDSISGDDAGDTEEITITMLDADYVEFTQTVSLSGQNRVALTPGLRVNRAFNSNGTPTAGNVYIYENTAISGGVPIDVTKVRGYFSISGQQTLQSIYTVPAGKTAYLYELKTSMGGRKTGFATYEAFLRVLGSIFLIKDTHDLSAIGTSYSNDIFKVPRSFPEKTDFKPKVTVDTNGIGFAVSVVVILVDN